MASSPSTPTQLPLPSTLTAVPDNSRHSRHSSHGTTTRIEAPSKSPTYNTQFHNTHAGGIQPSASFFRAQRPSHQLRPPSIESSNLPTDADVYNLSPLTKRLSNDSDDRGSVAGATAESEDYSKRPKQSRDPLIPLSIGARPGMLRERSGSSGNGPLSPSRSATGRLVRNSLERVFSLRRGMSLESIRKSSGARERSEGKPNEEHGMFDIPASPYNPKTPHDDPSTDMHHTPSASPEPSFFAPVGGPSRMEVPIVDPVTHKPMRNYELHPSRNRFFFQGRVLTGGDSPWAFTGSFLLLLTISGTWFGTTAVWWWHNISPAVSIICGYMALITISSMLATAMRDPGILPRNLDPDPPYPATSPSDGGIRAPMPRDLKVRSDVVRVKYCPTCKTYRPPRSSHCKMCDNCVDGCDHHCQWVNNCIGRRNYTSFFVMLVSVTLTLVLIISTSAIHLALLTTREHISFRQALKEGAGSAVVFLLSILVFWPVTLLLMYHMRLLLLNITTLEQIRNQAHKTLVPGPAPPNPFSHGTWRRNLLAVLCRPVGYSWVMPGEIAVQDERMRSPKGGSTPESTPPPASKPSAKKAKKAATESHTPPIAAYPYIMNPPPPGYPPYPTAQYPPGAPPPHPPPAQYAYHSPFAPHFYAQYPPHLMMYGPPPGHSAEPPESSSARRKRKAKDKTSDDEDDASPVEPTPPHHVQHPTKAVELKKRSKTARACDSCRSRKIRCDVLSDSEPPTCQHCKQYNFDCTFFLPITETRFKKKRLEEEEKEKAAAEQPRDSSVLGPTSTAHLLHSTASISSRIYETYDSRWHHTFEVSKSGDGLIRVEKPAVSEEEVSIPKPADLQIEPKIIEQLLNAYFAEVAPILPVITQAEFVALSAPPPVLLYSMCLVAAARRETPQATFDSIRYATNAIIKAEDVLSTPTLANVQALLILCMTGDCHSQFVPTALSAMWARLGCAIRMAQDLGLHRAELVKQNDIEARRRVWGACLISDRWSSLVYGFPYMIDVLDCDVRLPSSGNASGAYMDELVRLSVIGGKVTKTIYSPSGLTHVTDDMLQRLLADIEAWKANLPESLTFRGAESPQSAGILHLLFTSVSMIFWRVFMRISYTCPAHLKFALTVEQWSALVQLTGDCIDWLDTHEQVYDIWLLIAYAATSCAFVQYHTWVRRQDPEAAAKLRKLRDCVRRWEGSLSPDHMSARRKTAEIITLLYEATQGPQLPLETPALNPTGGVKNKQPAALNYKPDPERPGSGVFVARKDSPEDFKDLAPGTVIKDGETPATPTPATPQSASAPMVNMTPLPGRAAPSPSIAANMNPAMNSAGRNPGNVQVMNVLDVPQTSGNLDQFAMSDNTFLEGIPGGMFDWGQWDTFFQRIQQPPPAPPQSE
ncbi:hypothetical protein MKEN_01219700 [Mycena kentingensis (nom. inval.)]|nr:hypothetical protein MKEN_01219700 [Mycena kentingensis (nom. inval.)]